MGSLCQILLLLCITLISQIRSETRFCSGGQSCACTNDDLCTLQCNGKDKCKGSDVTLGCRAGYPCNVVCNSAGDENACQDTIIDGSQATDVTVACHDKQACMSARILCGTGRCNVICISTDSTGSNCAGLDLECGSGNCEIQCDVGPNMCSNVKVLNTAASLGFQCVASGDECDYINSQLAPFTRTTSAPSRSTLYPTKPPTLHPSLSPTTTPTSPTNVPSVPPSRTPSHRSLNPTRSPSVTLPTFKPSSSPTARPTNRPSVSPTRKPTQNPSARPTARPTNRPSMSPTRKPTHMPLIPGTPTRSPVPSFAPTIARTTTREPTRGPLDVSQAPTQSGSPSVSPTTGVPTRQVYWVVKELTNAPSRAVRVFVEEQSVNADYIVDMAMANKLYSSIAAGFSICCILFICIGCCRRKKRVAKPAYAPAPVVKNVPRRKSKNAGNGANYIPSLMHVKSVSGVSGASRGRHTALSVNGSASSEPVIGVRAGASAKSLDSSALEGLEGADFALPATRALMTDSQRDLHDRKQQVEVEDDSRDLGDVNDDADDDATLEFEISHIKGDDHDHLFYDMPRRI